MKYTIIGGAGNIAKKIVEKLLEGGQHVTVVGRDPKHLEGLVAKGAKTAIGSIEDVNFLIKAFAGADAVFTMVPPDFGVTQWKNAIAQKGKNFAQAIKANNVKYVVNLSSIGAHLPDGAGPINGLHFAELELNKLTDVNIKHLRAGYFYSNLLSNIEPAKKMNIIGSNFGGDNFTLVMTTPVDIADVAAEELLIHNFTGHSVQYVSSDERTANEIAKVLGGAIGKPDIPWITFTDEQAMEAMINAGLSHEIAKNYVEMNHGFQDGTVEEHYWRNRPASLQKTKLEDFAKTFADVYNVDAVPVHG